MSYSSSTSNSITGDGLYIDLGSPGELLLNGDLGFSAVGSADLLYAPYAGGSGFQFQPASTIGVGGAGHFFVPTIFPSVAASGLTAGASAGEGTITPNASGQSAGLIVNITYDQPVSSLPAGFTAAVNDAVQFLESTFTNPVTINIDIGYGEIAGTPLSASDIGESLANYVAENYSEVLSILQAENAPGAASVPATSPLRGALETSLAEAQALGLAPSDGSVDGYVGISSSLPLSYSASTPASNEYYVIGVLEHEMTEVMGRVSWLNDQPRDYALIDLFRYTSSGVRDLATGGKGSTAYFSIDNGVTNLGTWNNDLNVGDLADWVPPGPTPNKIDAFDYEGSPGALTIVSSNDITLMEALGWTTSALSGPTITSVTDSPSTGDLNAGKTVTITLALSEVVTVTGAPTLTLNDGGTASYAGGPASNSLSFAYTVGASDSDVSSLAVTAINVAGATIEDGSGNNANLSLIGLTQTGPQIDTTIPAITSVAESPSSGDLNAGNMVTITLGLSEMVTVTGTPTLTLNDGGTASYAGGSGTSALGFSYTVAATDSDVPALAVASIGLNGGAIQDGAGNSLNPSLTGLTQSGPQIDIMVPTVTSVAASADHQATSLNAGNVVTITVATSEPVTVTGTPELQLNDNEVALYTIGSGGNTLSFTYTVQLGDNIDDLQVTGLALPSGASIYDASLETLSGGVTADLGLSVNTQTPPPTSVQQEILGLYAALYNRAADFPGYSYWVGVDGQQSDSGGATVANASTTAVTAADAQLLGQGFVNDVSAFFNQSYGGLTDSQFINALYMNIGGNAGDSGGIAYWAGLLAQAEAGGASVQAARAGLVGEFVQELIDVNLSTFTGLTSAQLSAAEQRQETIDNKIAVSLAYSNASQPADGAILDPHTIGDAAYQAATAALAEVSYTGISADVAIAGIQLAVAHQDLLYIV